MVIIIDISLKRTLNTVTVQTPVILIYILE